MRSLLIVCLCLSLIAGAVAQGAKKPQPKPAPKPAAPTAKVPIFQTGPFDSTGMLMRKEVQAELKLTPAQITGIKEATKSGGRIAAEPGVSRKIVNKFLTIPQQVRYQEIILQRQDLSIVTLPEISKAIGLSKDQVKQMYTLIAELNAANADIASMEISEAEMKRRSAVVNAKRIPGLRAIFSTAQWATWQKLLGKPFGSK
ncbi:MAG: hypothetical protein K1X67_21455 [Fimbriimonadaceae bacterium]|nr:hypothetical protein [Fimbriimonadaceae bacterium]